MSGRSGLHFSCSCPRRGERRAGLLALLLALGAAFAPSVSLADVVYLKNGRKLVADEVIEDGKRVVLVRGGDEMTIPRALVERIEKSDLPPPADAAGSGEAADLPLPELPAVEATPSPEGAVIQDESLDEAALLRLDDEVLRNPSAENRHRLAQGYQQTAIFLTRKGDPEAAIERYRHALKFAPDDLALTLAMGYLLVKQNHHREAIELLLPTATRHANSPDVRMLLGSAYYASENLDRAIAEWNKALAIQDHPRLREALARAEQERSVAGSYHELRSLHFLLRCEGSEVRALGEEVLQSLEAGFDDLQRELDFYPRETIVVLLYPNQAFRDVSRSPDWVGAVNDGKIRVPVSGLTTVTADVARLLKHELTHSFVRQITLGRCPTWFNEGLAQLEEGATTAGLGAQLARAVTAGRVPALASLESSFLELPADQVGLAYAKSLAALEYLRDTFGRGEIRRLLRLMASNPNFAAVLQDHLRLSYPAFEQEVAHYIVTRYGS